MSDTNGDEKIDFTEFKALVANLKDYIKLVYVTTSTYRTTAAIAAAVAAAAADWAFFVKKIGLYIYVVHQSVRLEDIIIPTF